MFEAIRTLYFIRRGLAASHWSPQHLQREQEHRLQKLLIHAYENVSLYKALYDQAGFRPEMFRSLKDLTKIPVLRKERLKATPAAQAVSRGTDLRKCVSVATSGSTGTPLRIYLGPREQSWQRATAWRILFEHSYRWTDRTMEIRQTPGKTFRIQAWGIAPKQWVPILDGPQQWAEQLQKTKPQILIAAAGTLHALAETLKEWSTPPHRPKLIVSDSETLSPNTRHIIRCVLGADPVDVYGLVELSNFAWECQRRQGFHISADSHVVEVDAPPGQAGPIIATDLGMFTMPMIRYDTGDMGEAAVKPCLCGRTLPMLARIHGRNVDSVVLPEGRKLFWPFFHEILGQYDQLDRWRILQEDVGQITLQLVSPTSGDELIGQIESDLRRALPNEIKLQIQKVDAIDVGPGEKTRMILSTIGRKERS